MSGQAQITIAGTFSREHVAALVDIAMAAGAALLVQPRQLAPAPVVEASAKALPASPREARKPRKEPATMPAGDAPAAAFRALRRGPLRAAAFREATGLNKPTCRQLVQTGAIVASGATHSRVYALPGSSAKEAL